MNQLDIEMLMQQPRKRSGGLRPLGFSRGEQDNTPVDLPTPEEESDLLGNTTGAISWLADSLGKLGYATRGALAGKPDALLNAIPFYDTIQGYTKGTPYALPEAPKVTGWDLGEHWGMPKNKQGLDPWDIPKFGLEFLDPSMLFTAMPRVAGTTAKGLETVGALAKGTKAVEGVSDVAKAVTAAEKLAVADDAMASAGKAAAGLGGRPAGSVAVNTPLGMANQVRSGERAAFGLQVPFAKAPFATWGAGNEKVAKAVEAVGYGPLGRVYRGLFSKVPGVGGSYDARFQKAADNAYENIIVPYETARMHAIPAWKEVQQNIKGLYDDMAKSLGKQGEVAPFSDFTRDVLSNLEGVPDADSIMGKMTEYLGASKNALPAEKLALLKTGMDDYHGMLSGIQRTEDAMRQWISDLGGPVGEYGNQFERYATRMASDAIRAKGFAARGVKAPPDSYNWFAHRRAWLDPLPNSTVVANQMARDAALTGRYVAKDGTVARMAASEHKPILEKALKELGIEAPKKATREELQALLMENQYIKPSLEKAVKLGRMNEQEAADYLAMLHEIKKTSITGPRTSRAKVPATINKTTRKTLRAMGKTDEDIAAMTPQEAWDAVTGQVTGGPKSSAEGIEAAKALGQFSQGIISKSPLARIVRGLNKLPHETLRTGIWDKDAVYEAGKYLQHGMDKGYMLQMTHNFLKQKGVVGHAADFNGRSVPLLEAWKETGMTAKGLEKFVGEAYKVAPENAMKYARDLHVDTKALGVIRHYRELQKPEVIGQLGKTWDSIQNVYKAWWTVPKLGFHFRNDVGNFYNAMAEGLVPARKLMPEWVNAHSFIASGGTKGKLQYLDEFVTNGGLGGSGITDMTGMGEAFADLKSASLKGIGADLWRGLTHPIETLKTFHKTGGKEWDVATGQMVDKPVNALLSAGNKAFKLVESAGKIAYYEALRKNGYSPAQAMYHTIERGMFDYSKASPFVKRVGRRLVPFAGWITNNIPLQVSRILSRPVGSVTGMTVKTMASLTNDQKEFIPSFMREGFGFRWGGTPENTSYIRTAGLPVEDLNKLVFTDGVPNVGRTIKKNISMMSPLITAPMELSGLTGGEQLFTGRKLKDLENVTGSRILDSVLHYSPISGIEGDVANVLKPGKPVGQKMANLLTGVKFGNYDAEKLRLIELQKAMSEQAAENPMVGEMTIPYRKPQYKGDPKAADVEKQLKRIRKLSTIRRKLAEKREAAGAGR